MKNIKLKIEGMHCQACATRLEKVLKNTQGVEEANVNINDNVAQIQYNDEQINIKRIEEVIDEAGFKSLGE